MLTQPGPSLKCLDESLVDKAQHLEDANSVMMCYVIHGVLVSENVVVTRHFYFFPSVCGPSRGTSDAR